MLLRYQQVGVFFSYFTVLHCPRIVAPTNGYITGNGTSYDSLLTFQCNLGYTLSGNQVLRCGPNGKWNSRRPTCLGMSKHIAVKLIFCKCSHIYKLVLTEKVCKVKPNVQAAHKFYMQHPITFTNPQIFHQGKIYCFGEICFEIPMTSILYYGDLTERESCQFFSIPASNTPQGSKRKRPD